MDKTNATIEKAIEQNNKTSVWLVCLVGLSIVLFVLCNALMHMLYVPAR